MKKKAKILFFFSLIFLVLILYLILTSEPAKQSVSLKQPVKNQITALSEEDYKAEVKEIFITFEKLARDNSFKMDKIAELKNKLLALKGLPAKFKELHLKFVSALDQAEDYLKQKDEQGKNASQQIGNQLKADYSWLNN